MRTHVRTRARARAHTHTHTIFPISRDKAHIELLLDLKVHFMSNFAHSFLRPKYITEISYHFYIHRLLSLSIGHTELQLDIWEKLKAMGVEHRTRLNQISSDILFGAVMSEPEYNYTIYSIP